jgi:hypothetical protein
VLAPVVDTKPEDVSPPVATSKKRKNGQEAAAPDTAFQTIFANLLELKKPEDPFDKQVKIAKSDRCDSSLIKEGMLLDRPARLVVLPNGNVRNQDLHKAGVDSDWNLGAELIAKQCFTADHYTEIKNVNKTQMAGIVKNEIGDSLAKVVFTKAPEANAMGKLLQEGSQLIEANASEEEKPKLYKKLWERLQKGEPRIMRGYIKRSEGAMDILETDTGMVKFVDADLVAKGEMPERMLNLNNVTEVTFRLTKYVLK